MSVAALILSIIAILVAAASVVYVRRQALAGEEANRVGNIPQIELELDRDQQQPLLVITHQGGPDLDELKLEVVTREDGQAVPIPGIGVGTLADMLHADLGTINAGQRRTVRAALSSSTHGEARFRITCRRRHRGAFGRSPVNEWVLVRVVVVPQPPYSASAQVVY